MNSNDEYEAIWALVDSGSSVHVIDVEAVLPGAKIRKPDANAQWCHDRRRRGIQS